jgi:hypothetical protein
LRAHLAVLLLVAATSLAGADELSDPVAADLAAIERNFGVVPHESSLAALDALATAHPSSLVAPRALVWRAQLAGVDGDERGAIDRYHRVILKYPSSPSVALAYRGLGDLAFRAHEFGDADALYERGLERAEPVLAAELTEKRAMVAKWRMRRNLFVAALAAQAAIALLLFVRIVRGRGPMRFPVELAYALPIVVLLVGAARLFAHEAFPTLAIGGLGGALLFGLSGLAAERDPPRRRRDLVIGTVAVLVAVVALGYVAVYAGGLTDKLVDTLVGEPA